MGEGVGGGRGLWLCPIENPKVVRLGWESVEGVGGERGQGGKHGRGGAKMSAAVWNTDSISNAYQKINCFVPVTPSTLVNT